MLRMYYFYSVTCPWCTRLIHFIDVLSERFDVVRINIDTNSPSWFLDMNALFNYVIFGKVKYSAPLLVIEYVKDGVRRYLYIAIHEEKGEMDDIERDVLRFIVSTLKALSSIGVDVDGLLKDDVVKEYFRKIG